MTLNDFLKRVDIEKDGDKMLLHCDYVSDDVVAWTNLEIDSDEYVIRLLPDRTNSPFSSDK